MISRCISLTPSTTLISKTVVPYCASKWAVEGLNRALTNEMPCGFAVVALSLGAINTEMLQSCFENSALGYQTPDASSMLRWKNILPTYQLSPNYLMKRAKCLTRRK
ncbi:hypothetical protein PVK06_020063 [Gossypium arboreum]|uniref:Uncharacterized protein n=1 Tax=Gossypium arboreum TaxID=29729 RepID=A0ABR0PLR6_GOSAR|nr:hypothetical protein PVK06_020063 [Gossypium arboreum]